MTTPYIQFLISQGERIEQELFAALEGGPDTLNKYLEEQSQLYWARDGCIFYIESDTIVFQETTREWYHISESTPLIEQGILCPVKGLILDKVDPYKASSSNSMLLAEHIVEGWYLNQD